MNAELILLVVGVSAITLLVGLAIGLWLGLRMRLKVDSSRYQSEACTDSLTQLPNRRMLDNDLARRLTQWGRSSTPFALVLLDIDHFKPLNDCHGHLAGDAVLVQVARALAETIRSHDLPTRFGGDEFAIVLSTSSEQDSVAVAERARIAVGELVVEYEKQQLNVSISCGVAQVTAGDTAESLIRRADEALYAAKDSGRNAVFSHDGQRPQPARDAKKEPSPSHILDIPMD